MGDGGCWCGGIWFRVGFFWSDDWEFADRGCRFGVRGIPNPRLWEGINYREVLSLYNISKERGRRVVIYRFIEDLGEGKGLGGFFGKDCANFPGF